MKNKQKLVITILSIAFICIMNSAAISPALGAIGEHFHDSDTLMIQSILTLPSLCIIFTSLFFNLILEYLSIKKVAYIGLALYLIGGIVPGFLDNLNAILFFRALSGIGTGLLMPLSTGLLAYFFTHKELPKLMGYAAAMNGLGAVIGTLFSGALVNWNWRLPFFIYIFAFITVFFVVLYLPDVKMEREKEKMRLKDYQTIAPFIIIMILNMLIFYSIPTNFSLVCNQNNIIPKSLIGFVMVIQPLAGFVVSAVITKIYPVVKDRFKYIGFLFYLIGFGLICFMVQYPILGMIGLAFVGFGTGYNMPMLNAQVGLHMTKQKVTNGMALMSAAMFFGQFISPIILKRVVNIFDIQYATAPFIVTVIFTLIAFVLLKFVKFKKTF